MTTNPYLCDAPFLLQKNEAHIKGRALQCLGFAVHLGRLHVPWPIGPPEPVFA